MFLAPEENRGIYYSRQNRRSNAWQVSAALSKFASGRSGEHLLKAGVDLMQSRLIGRPLRAADRHPDERTGP